jgi:hypothetical protein
VVEVVDVVVVGAEEVEAEEAQEEAQGIGAMINEALLPAARLKLGMGVVVGSSQVVRKQLEE